MARRADHIGGVLRGRLEAIQARDPRLGDIRGCGAMMAAEFVDPETGSPDAALATTVAKACIAEGVIVLTCGTYGNVMRFLPPLSIGDDLLHEAMDILDQELIAAEAGTAPTLAGDDAPRPDAD